MAFPKIPSAKVTHNQRHTSASVVVDRSDAESDGSGPALDLLCDLRQVTVPSVFNEN